MHKVVKQNTSVCQSVCSSVSLPPLVQYVSPCTFLSLLIYRRALWFVVHGNACKWWVTNHGRLVRHYYCKAMLKMNGLFMSPCNESHVALWLWFLYRRRVIFSVMICNSRPFWKLLGCQMCTRECLRCPCVLYMLHGLHSSCCQALYNREFVTTTSAPFVWVYCFTTL